MQRSDAIVSPEDQKVTVVELFFDLVFVFCITQVVGLLHDGITWTAVGQAVLSFWMVWWAWTQFTWTLNAADTTHTRVELATLLATAIAFFMAVAIPQAFHGHPAWFAVPYVLVRATGLLLYGWVAASADANQHAAVRGFAIMSMFGMAAVLAGGFADGRALYVLWSVAILLDLIAAAVGSRHEGWNLHAEHFAERHGLIVIIALGETLIVAAGGFATGDWSTELMAVAALAVILTCAYWWSYFTRVKPILDGVIESATGPRVSRLGHDLFSILHFPILCGVIAYATVIEHAIAHPHDPLALSARLALAAGVVLFLGGSGFAVWRAARIVLVPRVAIMFITATLIVVVADASPAISLAIALAGITGVALWEQFTLPLRQVWHADIGQTPREG